MLAGEGERFWLGCQQIGKGFERLSEKKASMS
jgi:hypothetical protein